MIEISHLIKKYGGHTAVDDLSLTVEPGRIYGFLGPNGAGKSTTLNIVTGYLGATGGEVKINGFDIFKQPEEAKKHIGYLPEVPPLYMDMGVEEYLCFAAELKAIEKTRRRQYIQEAMELTQITDMGKRLIRNLSKGYRQRVGLAQAILGYPEVIILDEPTVGLDPRQIMEIRELIKKLGEHHTVILSSHILSEVREVCDYIYILSKYHTPSQASTPTKPFQQCPHHRQLPEKHHVSVLSKTSSHKTVSRKTSHDTTESPKKPEISTLLLPEKFQILVFSDKGVDVNI